MYDSAGSRFRAERANRLRVAAIALLAVVSVFAVLLSLTSGHRSIPIVTGPETNLIWMSDPTPSKPESTPRSRIPVADLDEVVFDVTVGVREASAVSVSEPAALSSSEIGPITYDLGPRPVCLVRPEYPRIARNAGVEGIVLVRLDVDQEGLVTDATIETASDAIFRNPTLLAIKRWRFEPAQLEGVPVSSTVVLPIEFVLKDDPDVHVSSVRPRAIFRVPPTYPLWARAQRIEGVVHVRAWITDDGWVERAKAVRASDEMFVRAAEGAVLRWRFNRRQPDEEGIRLATVRVDFRL